jgi:hypothetical protein
VCSDGSKHCGSSSYGVLGVGIENVALVHRCDRRLGVMKAGLDLVVVLPFPHQE